LWSRYVFSLYNLSGAEIFKDIVLKKGENTIDVSGLPTGIYFLKNKKYSFKFVKQ